MRRRCYLMRETRCNYLTVTSRFSTQNTNIQYKPYTFYYPNAKRLCVYTLFSTHPKNVYVICENLVLPQWAILCHEIRPLYPIPLAGLNSISQCSCLRYHRRLQKFTLIVIRQLKAFHLIILIKL